MFIRWKRRKKAAVKPGFRPRRRRNVGDSLSCVLVESQRIDGKPRQKIVCYLASFDENDRDAIWLRVDFWDYVTARLDRLQLGQKERVKIEESIGKVVVKVPEQEAAAFRKARQEYKEKKARLIQNLRVMRLLGM